MTENWQNLKEKDVFKQWKPLGIITGLDKESGVFDDSPLHDFIQNVYDDFGDELKRKITVSCADVNTGNYIVFNETSTDIPKSVVSSASIPFAFPHQVWEMPDGSQIVCMDGGTVYNTNLVSAVDRCREQVDHDEEITVDIVICDSAELESWENQNDAVNNFLRFSDLKNYHSKIADVYNFKQAFPKVNFRYYIEPSTPLPGGLAILDFNNQTNTFPM